MKSIFGAESVSSQGKTAPENQPYWRPLRPTTVLGLRVETEAFPTIRRPVIIRLIPLVRVLRLSFDNRTGAGFFLRAESFFNTATHIDRLDAEPGFGPPISLFYGGKSLHPRSHGETFFTVLELKFQRNGLFLLDEPEAALSPQRQLSFLVLIHDVLQKYKDAQFIISTHSPVFAWVSGGADHFVRWRALAGDQILRDRSNADRALISE
jgi:hypothetical protein